MIQQFMSNTRNAVLKTISTRLTGTALNACGAGSMKGSRRVRLSVPAAAGLLLSADPVGDIHRQRRAPCAQHQGSRSTALSSKYGQCHVESRVDDAEHRLVSEGLLEVCTAMGF